MYTMMIFEGYQETEYIYWYFSKRKKCVTLRMELLLQVDVRVFYFLNTQTKFRDNRQDNEEDDNDAAAAADNDDDDNEGKEGGGVSTNTMQF